MSELPITSLPPRMQRQVENARTAIDRGNGEYAINICREVLLRHPGCLPVRRLLRAAQQTIFKKKNRLLAKTTGGLKSLQVLALGSGLVRKDPGKAMDAAERVLSVDPANAGALKLLSKAAFAADLRETAVFSLETLHEHKPSDRRVAIELAEAYISANRSADSLAVAERLISKHPGDAELKELLKRASVAQSISKGRWDSDSGSYRDKLRDEESAVLAEQSNKVILSDEMAGRLIDQGLAAIEAEPANLRNYLTVINGYRALRRFDEALEWLGRARQVPTGAGDVTLEKVETELKIARLEALIEQRAAVVVDPENDEELRRMRHELDAVRIDSLKALVEKYPTDQDFKFELGKLYKGSGRLDLAIQQFQSAQRNARLRVAALTELGACFQGKGLYDLAVQQYETAKNEIDGFDDTKKAVVYELASCYEAMNQKEKALVEYKLIYSWDISFRDVASKIDQSYTEP